MKRILSAGAAFGLFMFAAPLPAYAASCQTAVDGLGIVCVDANGENVIVSVKDALTGATLLSTSVPVPVQAPITVTIPGPTVEVPVPGPTSTATLTIAPGGAGSATATVTKTAPGSPAATVTQTITVTKNGTVTETSTDTATSSDTETATATSTVTTGQSAEPSGILSESPTLPTVTTPPTEQSEAGVDLIPDLIPDDPKAAAATGSLLGLAVGIILGIIGLFVAYRRGQLDGEKSTLQEFLGVIRGEPQPGRHRAL